MQPQISNFLEDTFQNKQGGFRNMNHSTISAIAKFTGNTFQSINNNEHSTVIFMDMKKGF